MVCFLKGNQNFEKKIVKSKNKDVFKVLVHKNVDTFVGTPGILYCIHIPFVLLSGLL